MKRILVLFVLFTLSAPFTKAGGIDFVHDSTLTQLLARSKESGKLVFIDCYTTWCGPCKWMTKNIFPNDTVGDFFNTNFICAKIDMEKGDGKKIAERYKINAYPSYLFLDASGKEQHRFLGSMPGARFIENAKVALDEENRFGALKQKYLSGDRNPILVRKYISTLAKAGGDVNEPLDWYVTYLPDAELESADNIQFLSELPWFLRATTYERIQKHHAAFEKVLGAEKYGDFCQQFLATQFRSCFSWNNGTATPKQPQLDNWKKLAQASTFSGKDEFLLDNEYETYMMLNDLKSALDHVEKHPLKEASFMNELAWKVYEGTDDKELLRKALKLSKRSVELADEYNHNDTYAALCYKLGMKKEAKKHAEKAIKQAKEDGTDASATEELLENIKKMK